LNITIRLFLHLEYRNFISRGRLTICHQTVKFFISFSIGITWTAAKYLPKTLFITDYRILSYHNFGRRSQDFWRTAAGAGWIGGSDAATEGGNG
jgi:hypothetical protein